MIRPLDPQRVTAALALVLSLAAVGLRAQTEITDRLVPVPEVDLRGVDEAVRDQIAEQRKLLDDALAAGALTSANADQLGLLFGEAGQL